MVSKCRPNSQNCAHAHNNCNRSSRAHLSPRFLGEGPLSVAENDLHSRRHSANNGAIVPLGGACQSGADLCSDGHGRGGEKTGVGCTLERR